MSNQVTAINTYSNTDGSRKVLGFDDQDSMLAYIKESVDNGDFTEDQVLWKAYVPAMLGVLTIREFWRIVNGSLKRTLIKDYFREVKHVRDPVPFGYATPDQYVETFTNMWHWLDKKDWLLVWQT